MFGNTHTEVAMTGTVVSYRKAAVETFVTVDTKAGQRMEIAMTRPRFDSMSIHNGSQVAIDDHQHIIGMAS